MDGKVRIALAAVAAAVAAALFAPAAAAAGSVESGKAKAAVCAGCHGADGNSPADLWPKVAGQLPQYLSRQLHDFKAGRRRDDQMSPMAQPLSAQDIEDLAAFFAAQKADRGPADPPPADGRKLYLQGKGRPAPVPACVGCHGPNGAGKNDWSATMKEVPAILAPAIAGQHPAYTARQLVAYRAGARRNDTGHVMRDVAARLTDAEIEAVAGYVATLVP